MSEGVENKTHLELPPDKMSLHAAASFIDSFAESWGVENDKRTYLRTATEMTLNAIVRNSAGDSSRTRIGLNVFENDGNLVVEVINRGVPVFLSAHSNGSSKIFHEATQHLDKISWENHGREGQTVVLGMRLGEQVIKANFQAAESYFGEVESEKILIRELREGEENALCQLFYAVYGYSYINDYVYYPEKIRTLVDTKKLISIVAVLPDDRLVGHVGLIQRNDDPLVYEPCLGITDPRLKSKGVFSKLFARTMEWVRELPMQYCFFDFVTNHDYSQRFVSRYQPIDLALFVGCQSKDTQAKLQKLGLGPDPKEMERYTLLYSLIPRVEHPFGKEVLLPNNVGEMLGFLLKPLNLRWVPSPRFHSLSLGGQYETHLQPNQGSVIFDLTCSGREAVSKILKDWQTLLRNGYQYAGIEVALEQPGLGNLYDILSSNGFFVSGFVPYKNSAKLALRFQSIGPTKVAFEEIKVYTETAKKLLQVVRSSYEENRIL